MQVLGGFISLCIYLQQERIVMTAHAQNLQISKMSVPELLFKISSPEGTFQGSLYRLSVLIDN